MKAEAMYIRLDGLKFYARHGVFPQETRVGAEFTVDLCLRTDFSQAAEADALEGTVSYAEVFERVKAEMEIPSRLLEHVVYRIARRLLDDFPMSWKSLSACISRTRPWEPIAAGWG